MAFYHLIIIMCRDEFSRQLSVSNRLWTRAGPTSPFRSRFRSTSPKLSQFQSDSPPFAEMGPNAVFLVNTALNTVCFLAFFQNLFGASPYLLLPGLINGND